MTVGFGSFGQQGEPGARPTQTEGPWTFDGKAVRCWAWSAAVILTDWSQKPGACLLSHLFGNCDIAL